MKRFRTSIVLALVLSVALTVPAFAAGPLTNSEAGVTYDAGISQNDLSGGSVSRNAEVEVTRAGSFSVTIPKKITLPGTSDASGYHKTGYNITVKGDIGSNEQINVVPQSSVTLKQSNKADVTASVTQGAQHFKLSTTGSASFDSGSNTKNVLYSDMHSDSGYTTSGDEVGEVSARNLSAGTWSGTYTYQISLETI